jgi:hypothetical protein
LIPQITKDLINLHPKLLLAFCANAQEEFTICTKSRHDSAPDPDECNQWLQVALAEEKALQELQEPSWKNKTTHAKASSKGSKDTNELKNQEETQMSATKICFSQEPKHQELQKIACQQIMPQEECLHQAVARAHARQLNDKTCIAKSPLQRKPTLWKTKQISL